MAHRSKKKHIKHLHEHEPATPRAKSPVAKADVARAGAPKASRTESEPKPKKRGIVRRAARKLTAKPRKIARRAKARVKSIIGFDA